MVESPKGFHQLALSDVSKPKLSCSVKGKGFFPEIHEIEWVGTYLKVLIFHLYPCKKHTLALVSDHKLFELANIISNLF